MAELYGSKRTVERATYTPIKASRRRPDPAEPHPYKGRAWDKWSYFSSLGVTRTEIRHIAERIHPNATHEERRALEQLRDLVDAQGEVPRVGLAVERVAAFQMIPDDLLVRIGTSLVDVRTAAHEEAISAIEQLSDATSSERPTAQLSATSRGSQGAPAVPPGYELDPSFVHPAFPGARLYRLSESRQVATEARQERRERVQDEPVQRARTLRGMQQSERVLLVPSAKVAVRRPPAIGSAARTVADLAVDANARGVAANAIATIRSGVLAPRGETLTPLAYKYDSAVAINAIKDINRYFVVSRQTEPVGMLHLERVNFIPAGIERGELMHSVPLSPGEEVNITHKEWSNTSEEFERIATDYLEHYSEEGVVEKSEFSQSTNSQHQHSSGFNMSVTASGGFGPMSVTSSVGYNLAESSSKSEQIAKHQTSEVTRKAASRTRQEHKVSFKVASAAGTEEQAVRKIKNPFDDKATRLDFYQLVRKWQVDLYRYGVRLTYDITIPEPGSDILSKVIELNALRAALQQPFGSAASTVAWARFELNPYEIDRLNYTEHAATYGAALETPLAETIVIPKSFSRNWGDLDETQYGQYVSFEMEVPAEYAVTGVSYSWSGWSDEDDGFVQSKTNLDTWVGASGRLTYTYSVKATIGLQVELTIYAALRDQVYEAWQMRVWNTLREAARARYEAQRASIKDRIATLQNELGGQDPLSLRKIEREEVMKGVLRWLFGPSFNFMVPGLGEEIYGAEQTIKHTVTWNQVLGQGEVIKFLHHAIEWENMTYFLYPYFWSHTSRWELKKYLDHPDFLHRAFLKAGAARVVLTVRPGFETDFVAFVETGGFNPLDKSHPYLTIAQELEAFAKTNYPGIRAANPVDAARPLLTPLQRRAWREMEGLVGLLEEHKVAHGRYPDTGEGLGALTPFGTVPAADPWGNAYDYRCPGTVADFELRSYGADGAEGGTGEDADITSWAEASLIGRWFDYTPTSALDIAFNETMPTA